MQFIDLEPQYEKIKNKIHERIETVLNHRRFINGPEIQELEKKLEEYSGAKYAIGCASGTDALMLALMAAGVKAGDEVITTPFTFFATAEMIAILGAKPVFADIDLETYNIDPAYIEKSITKKTKAIIPVSLYGQPADMDAINAIADKHSLVVIEDGAQSFGAKYKERKSCALSTLATTSFFPAKPLGGYGDGGAVFADNKEMADKMISLRNHGQGERYQHAYIGFNGRLDTIQAAILLEKLAIFNDEVIARERIANRYTQALKDIVKTPYLDPNCTSVYAQYTIQVKDRATFQKNMQAKGVPLAVHYPRPLHMQPVFEDLKYKKGDFPNAEKIAQHVVSLPMYPYLDEETQDEIIEAVKTSI
ncbi:MAG: DegT/DnrJ/EryC1/StrS family aminotransferase [Bacteriovoracia bacterium]